MNIEYQFTHEELRTRIEKDLVELQKSDHVKSVITPLKLADTIIGKIPMCIIPDDAKMFLAISDTGLLLALYDRLLKYRANTHRITFIAHTKEVADYVKEYFDVNVELVKHGTQLNDFFAGKLNVSDCVDYNNHCKMNDYDVILCNPPYQPDLKDSDCRGKSIWQLFVENAFTSIKDDGHLLFITPDVWRGGKSNGRCQHKRAQDFIWDNGVLWYTNCRKPVDYFSTVAHSIKISAWHVQKKKIKHKPKTTLERLQILVNDDVKEIFEKYFNVCENSAQIPYCGKGDQSGNSYIKKSPHGDDIHQYKVANTSAQVKKGYFHWSNKKHPHHDDKKVLVSYSGSFVIGYNDGDCGVGHCTRAYIVQNAKNGQRLVDFLKSPLIDYIAYQFVPRGSFIFPVEKFEKLPMTIFEHDWHDDLWKDSAKQVFGFTDEEIEEIK